MAINDILAPNARNKKERDQEIATLFYKFRSSPRFWVKYMFGLDFQPVKPEYENEVRECTRSQSWLSVKPEWFGDFERGKHITWQQWMILESVAYAMRNDAPRRISISSGHGIGKSTTCSWLMLWFLMCFPYCRVGVTSPSSDQLHDVLWTEAKQWIDKMPAHFAAQYDWTGSYIRMLDAKDPDARNKWWARARTARKENPEALAGLHSEHVMMIADEASGVEQVIFNTAEGALTDKNTLIVMISNPTRLYGYFYNSHHGDKDAWQRLQFSCLDSPLVDTKYVDRIKQLHGVDSDEFRIRVQGKFPKTESMDTEGYVPLFSVDRVNKTSDIQFNFGKKRLGIDVAGTGDDTTVWTVRDMHKARIVHEEKTSNEFTVATKTLTLMEQYGLKAEDVYLDMFGVGAKVAQQLAKLGHMVNAINVGDSLDRKSESVEDQTRYRNKRAQAYYRLRDWLSQGGELVDHPQWDEQLSSIRYRRNISGSIEIMSKVKMRKLLIKSPDHLDSLMLTFCDPEHLLETGDDDDDETDHGDDIYAGIFS